LAYSIYMNKMNIQCIILLLATASPFTFANDPTKIPYINKKVILDGVLTPGEWEGTYESMFNEVIYPYNDTTDITTKTYMFEDGEYLYVAFDAFTPNPDALTDFYRARDSAGYDDSVGIKIDTFNEEQFAYEFYVTPSNAQVDYLYNENSGSWSLSWNAIWNSAAQVTDTGYIVEMAIPLKSLNFKDGLDIQEWGIEFYRYHMDGQPLDISSKQYDVFGSCLLCHMDKIQGFENAEVGNNLVLTPSFVARNDSTRDTNNDWQDETNYEGSIDVRWGIATNVLFNATINPDFSGIDADSAELNVNETFSIYYKERRAFFTENTGHFDSPLDIIYTRNIADPEYGTKLTGTVGKHSFGTFFTKDQQTNILIPGNLGSDIGSILGESNAGAARYQGQITDNLNLGAIATIRDADEYHNYLGGVDAKYDVGENGQFQAQVLRSETLYPTEFQDELYGENVLRTRNDEKLTDTAYSVEYVYLGEKWQYQFQQQSFGEDFRADLGFIPQVDYKENGAFLKRRWVTNNDGNGYSYDAKVEWSSQDAQNGNYLGNERLYTFEASIPSYPKIILEWQDTEQSSLRFDDSILALTDNTEIFEVDNLFGLVDRQISTSLNVIFEFTVGDRIDFNNNRLGDGYEVYGSVRWSANKHLELRLAHSVEDVKVNNEPLFTANLSDFRVKYQFNEHSFLRLTLIYSNVDYNPDNYLFDIVERSEDVGTQLLYSYQVSPQTLVYLGYSDYQYSDDVQQDWLRTDKTFFAKFSYAWQL
jgi:hypothetical protein